MPPSHHNTAQKSALPPELRSWIDTCLVPILVRDYLGERESKNLACAREEPVAEFATTRTAIAEEGK